MTNLVYFSSISGNTHRLVEKLGLPAVRLPLHTRDDTYLAAEPYVLVLPTYGGGDGKGAVPKQVIKFLNVPRNRALIRGVIAAGNTNFGTGYGIAGDIVAEKCGVPCLYKVELFGTPTDIDRIREGLDRFWQRQQAERSKRSA